MIIYSEPKNFLSIKVALAVEVKNVPSTFEDPKLKDGCIKGIPKSFPYIEVVPGHHLFSTNNICKFFLYAERKIEHDEHLEWENSHLLPYVLNVVQASLTSGKISDSLKIGLHNCLKHLETLISNKSSPFNKLKPGLVDVVMWSTLYILASDEKLKKEFFEKYPKLTSWYDSLEGLQCTKNALYKILDGKDRNCLKDSLLAVNLALPSCKSIRNKQTPIATTAKLPMEGTSPTNEDETETEVTTEDINAAVNAWLEDTKPDGIRKATTVPVLPKKGERNILVTSALPYVNNVPHLGNIIGAILSADVFARYCRLRQYNTIYICGTDEYGTATETKALEEKTTPEEICTKYNKLHKEIYDWFNIKFDHFGRTSTQHQTNICQEMFWKLYNAGFVLTDTTEQLFCTNCSRFLADRFVEGICPFCSYEDARGDQCDKCQKLVNPVELIKPRCKVCRHEPQLKSSQHLFLDLPKLEPMLKTWLDGVTVVGDWSTTAKVICYAWLKEGLKPRAITRDLKWGTPVPLEGFTDKVFYVWFDAPIGYLSMTAAYTSEWEKWWKNPGDVQLYQFMAKDNVPFHGIIFPSSCLGSNDNFTVVNHLAAVEYLNYEDTKFSKSRGIGVFGNDAQDTGIPADIFRFYLLYIRPESQDTVFSWNDLMMKNNFELLNNLGNYANRALTFIYNNFAGKIPAIFLIEEDKILLVKISRELNKYLEIMEKTKLRDGIRHMLNISRLGNQHIQSNKPWELIKGDEKQRARAGTIMGLSANVSCLLSLLMEPYMPNIAEELRNQLNFPCEKKVLTPYFSQYLKEGHPLNKPIPLFKKIEQSEVEILKKKYAGKQDSPERQLQPEVKVESAVKVETPQVNADPVEIQNATDQVTLQGEKVRILKTQKAEKSVIDAEVAILLDLKKKLTALGGVVVSKPASQSQKKKGKNKNI